jgi:hypothetical protein
MSWRQRLQNGMFAIMEPSMVAQVANIETGETFEKY